MDPFKNQFNNEELLRIKNQFELFNFSVSRIVHAVMIPVSSTVIPLPVYKVGYGFGFSSKEKKYHSSYKPDGVVKLITGERMDFLPEPRALRAEK